MKICTSCRLQLGKEKTSHLDNSMLEKEIPAEDLGIQGPSHIKEVEYVDPDAALSYLNASLTSLGESPVSKKKQSSKKYCEQKMKIKRAYKESLFTCEDDSEEEIRHCSDYLEIIQQLKEKFETSDKSTKLMILTLVPKSWSCKKIENEFGVSNYIARKAKKLTQEKGILSTPDPKPGKALSDDTVNLVKKFYCSEEVSRQMPGKKDYISIKDKNGCRSHVQKCLILGNLREIYQLFKSKYTFEKSYSQGTAL